MLKSSRIGFAQRTVDEVELIRRLLCECFGTQAVPVTLIVDSLIAINYPPISRYNQKSVWNWGHQQILNKHYIYPLSPKNAYVLQCLPM